jgi:hypothetical protein
VSERWVIGEISTAGNLRPNRAPRRDEPYRWGSQRSSAVKSESAYRRVREQKIVEP